VEGLRRFKLQATCQYCKLSKYLIATEKYISRVIHNVHDQIITGLIEVWDQWRTTYDASGKDELGFWLRTDTVESQITIFSGWCMNQGIKWSNLTDREKPVGDGAREYEDELGENVAADGLDDHKVTSLLVVELGAAINEANILIEVDLGLVGNLEGLVLSNLDSVKDGG
jgi:hypothetical protein